MLRFAICDEDATSAGGLESLLLALNPLYHQTFDISVFFSGESFLQYLGGHSEIFDIVIMNMETGGYSGVEAGRRLRQDAANDHTLLVFTSENREHLSCIIDLHVFCFLQKPVAAGEFNEKLGNAIESILRKRLLPEEFPNLIVHKNRREIQVPFTSIVCLESRARQIHLYTPRGELVYYGVLGEEEKKLPAGLFARVHKSYIVNFSFIENIAAKELTLRNGRRFAISGRHREEVKAAYRVFAENEQYSAK
jgi:DNA-binding LytR/AlgR family response regulator